MRANERNSAVLKPDSEYAGTENMKHSLLALLIKMYVLLSVAFSAVKQCFCVLFRQWKKYESE